MQRRVVELMQEDVEASVGERLAMWEPMMSETGKGPRRGAAYTRGGFGGRLAVPRRMSKKPAGRRKHFGSDPFGKRLRR